jgi:hypothetical protein
MAQMILLSGSQYERPQALIKSLKALGYRLAFEIAVFAECREQPVILSEEEIKSIEASANVKVVHYLTV